MPVFIACSRDPCPLQGHAFRAILGHPLFIFGGFILITPLRGVTLGGSGSEGYPPAIPFYSLKMTQYSQQIAMQKRKAQKVLGTELQALNF